MSLPLARRVTKKKVFKNYFQLMLENTCSIIKHNCKDVVALGQTFESLIKKNVWMKENCISDMKG